MVRLLALIVTGVAVSITRLFPLAVPVTVMTCEGSNSSVVDPTP